VETFASFAFVTTPESIVQVAPLELTVTSPLSPSTKASATVTILAPLRTYTFLSARLTAISPSERFPVVGTDDAVLDRFGLNIFGITKNQNNKLGFIQQH
jgi:hypothetical protein